MESYEPYVSLGVALLAGLLIGIERELSAAAQLPKGTSPALGGARTHPLFALVGAVSMMVSQRLGAGVFLVTLAALGTLVGLNQWHDLKEGRLGLTSESALLLTFLLGALATSQGILEPWDRRALVILAVTVVATLLLSMKDPLHAFARKVSTQDVYATLKFLIVTVVVLPLLPNHAFGPLDVLNPRRIWLMVVLIAGISFAGYVAIRLLGPRRGLGLTGVVGGLVSSTAVTLTFSNRAKAEPALAPSCALAVVLASTIMFGRVLAIVTFVNPRLVAPLLVPMGVMGLTGALVSTFFYRRSHEASANPGEVQFTNPFELTSAIRFALLFTGILLATKAASTYLGVGATYLTGVLSGAADVAPITLSMAELTGDGIGARVAVTTILLGAISNTVVKGAMALILGGWGFGRRIALGFGAMVAVGLLSLLFVWR